MFINYFIKLAFTRIRHKWEFLLEVNPTLIIISANLISLLTKIAKTSYKF